MNAPQQPKIDDVTPFCDRLNEFLRRFSVNRSLIGISDLLSYIATGACFVFSLLFLILDCTTNGYLGSIMGVLTFSAFLPFTALYFSVLAVCKRNLLPLAVNLSYLTVANLVQLILNIVLMSKGSPFGSIITGFICLLLEVAVLAILSIRAWSAFALVSAPQRAAKQAQRQQQQMLYQQQVQMQMAQMQQQQMAQQQMQQQQMAQQQMQQPTPMQQPAPQTVPAAQPAPIPQVAPIPQPAPIPTPVQAPEAKVCSCGFENAASSKFCKKCGTKLN